MRRTGVLTLLLAGAFSLGCTERLLLPGGTADGGTGGNPGSGGRFGSSGGNGGLSGVGGKTAQGSGGSGRPSCSSPRTMLGSNIRKARMLLALGRDMAMNTRFGDGTRFSVVQQLLRSQVQSNQNAVAFGYLDYPSAEPCFDDAACCANRDWVNVAPNAFAAIDRALDDCDNPQPMGACFSRGDRPILDVFRSAWDLLGSDPNVDRYLVLITDGAPACFSEPDSAKACRDAKTEVANLSLLAGIKTYVVTVGEDVEQNRCLQDIAFQGGVATPNIYAGRDPTQLSQSLSSIVSRAAAKACIIELSSVAPMGAKVQVTLQGRELPNDPSGQNGWYFTPGSAERIEVKGNACTDIQRAAPSDIRVWADCNP